MDSGCYHRHMMTILISLTKDVLQTYRRSQLHKILLLSYIVFLCDVVRYVIRYVREPSVTDIHRLSQLFILFLQLYFYFITRTIRFICYTSGKIFFFIKYISEFIWNFNFFLILLSLSEMLSPFIFRCQFSETQTRLLY